MGLTGTQVAFAEETTRYSRLHKSRSLARNVCVEQRYCAALRRANTSEQASERAVSITRALAARSLTQVRAARSLLESVASDSCCVGRSHGFAGAALRAGNQLDPRAVRFSVARRFSSQSARQRQRSSRASNGGGSA